MITRKKVRTFEICPYCGARMEYYSGNQVKHPTMLSKEYRTICPLQNGDFISENEIKKIREGLKTIPLDKYVSFIKTVLTKSLPRL